MWFWFSESHLIRSAKLRKQQWRLATINQKRRKEGREKIGKNWIKSVGGKEKERFSSVKHKKSRDSTTAIAIWEYHFGGIENKKSGIAFESNCKTYSSSYYSLVSRSISNLAWERILQTDRCVECRLHHGRTNQNAKESLLWFAS